MSVETQWQAHPPSGIDASQFVLDWEKRQAICPQGKTRTSWSWLSRKSHPDLITIPFSTPDCRLCPRLCDGVQSTSKYPRRTLVIRLASRSMPHSKLHASSNGRKPSSRDMPCGQGLRRPFHKGCAPLTCAVLALWGCRKRMCNTWPSRRRSIWFALSTGLMATRSLLPAFRLLRGSTRRHEEFASSVVFVESLQVGAEDDGTRFSGM